MRVCAGRQMLGDLEESFNSLEKGSRDMVAQVRVGLPWARRGGADDACCRQNCWLRSSR